MAKIVLEEYIVEYSEGKLKAEMTMNENEELQLPYEYKKEQEELIVYLDEKYFSAADKKVIEALYDNVASEEKEKAEELLGEFIQRTGRYEKLGEKEKEREQKEKERIEKKRLKELEQERLKKEKEEEKRLKEKAKAEEKMRKELEREEAKRKKEEERIQREIEKENLRKERELEKERLKQLKERDKERRKEVKDLVALLDETDLEQVWELTLLLAKDKIKEDEVMTQNTEEPQIEGQQLTVKL